MPAFLANGLFFSEILADNAGSGAIDTDGDGGANKADEFIEIQSVNGSALSLDGIQIWSAKRGLLYEFQSGDTIEARGTATVVGQYDGAEPAGFYDAGLADNNGNAGLLEDGENNKFDTLYIVDTNTVPPSYIALEYGENAQTQALPTGFPGVTLLGSETTTSDAPNGTTIARDASGNLIDDTTPDPGNTGPVCYLAGTLIETADGPRPIEDLQPGTQIVTSDHGLQTLRWLGSCVLSASDLCARPKLVPILIRKGAFGVGLPHRDLYVSPQHRMLIESRITQRMFGHGGVLVPAVKLLGLPGITRANAQNGAHYYHLLFDQHQIVYAEGSPSESLLLGHMAQRALGADVLEELSTLLPELFADTPIPAARILPKPARLRSLVARHSRNRHRPLTEAA